MTIELPHEVAQALSGFDARADVFETDDVAEAVRAAVLDPNTLTPEARHGWWAEQAAFEFDTGDAPNGGPWKTYFQPWITATRTDGTVVPRPNLAQADAEVLAYWVARAKAAKHPVLVARYADLVWDVTEFVTKARRGRDKIEFVRLAIDSYIAASRLANASACTDTSDNLARALHLALSVKDSGRTQEAVKASIDYAKSTAEDDLIHTYCDLFDILLPPQKGPDLTEDQESEIITMFEEKFADITTPGKWDEDPHSQRDIGLRLAGYYQRKGRLNDRTRVLRAVAGAFERRARIGDPALGLIFLEEARNYYFEAGLRQEAERVQSEAQRLGPEAEKRLVHTTLEYEVPAAEVNRVLNWVMEAGMEEALLRFTRSFIPDQGEIAREKEEVAKDHPLYAMFCATTKKLGHGHIEADMTDNTGDPDGGMVHATADYIRFHTDWITWILDRMVQDGLTAPRIADFVGLCPLFMGDRMPLIRRGLEAHFMGDYTQAIHMLIPQVERALVNLLPLAGKPSNKTHQSGRGVMQFKNLNDLLARGQWPIPGDGGENLRMYLLSALAHPKGLNIRNDVCHGLWPANHFTRIVSERVLHVLLSVSMLRPAKGGEGRGEANAAGG